MRGVVSQPRCPRSFQCAGSVGTPPVVFVHTLNHRHLSLCSLDLWGLTQRSLDDGHCLCTTCMISAVFGIFLSHQRNDRRCRLHSWSSLWLNLNLKHPHCSSNVSARSHCHQPTSRCLMYLRHLRCLLSSQQRYRPSRQCTATEESPRSSESSLPLRRERDLEGLVDELRLLSIQALSTVGSVGASVLL